MENNAVSGVQSRSLSVTARTVSQKYPSHNAT